MNIAPEACFPILEETKGSKGCAAYLKRGLDAQTLNSEIKDSNLLSVAFSRWHRHLVPISLVALVAFILIPSSGWDFLWSAIFLGIPFVSIVLATPQQWNFLEHRYFQLLGQISYGINNRYRDQNRDWNLHSSGCDSATRS